MSNSLYFRKNYSTKVCFLAGFGLKEKNYYLKLQIKTEDFMLLKKLRFFILFLLIVFQFVGLCYATDNLPQPLGEITKQELIDKYLSGKKLDQFEGIWITTNSPQYEIAIIKNNFYIYPDYEYIGLVLSSVTNSKKPFKKGETKILIKTTAAENLGIGIWFMADRAANPTSFILEDNLITYIYNTSRAEKKSFLLRTYPKGTENKNKKAPGQTTPTGTGTGFLITSKLIATNHHVIDTATEIDITFSTGVTVKAKVVAQNVENDIAVLQLNSPTDIPPLQMGQSSETKQGEKIFTIGYPISDKLGSSSSKISEGIINNLTGYKNNPNEFQISVPIQPGNSGGPVFNSKGQVIGIIASSLNTESIGKGRVPQNVNFAMKAHCLYNLLNTLPGDIHLNYSQNYQELNAQQIVENYQRSVVLITARN